MKLVIIIAIIASIVSTQAEYEAKTKITPPATNMANSTNESEE